MNGWWRSWCLAAVAAASATGCAAPIPMNYLSGSRKQEAAEAQKSANKPMADKNLKAAAVRKATEEPQSPEAALAGVLDELQQIGAIDPQAQQELMADLKDAKPDHYPLIVEQFKSALAYRQQLAKREQRGQDQPTALAADKPLEPAVVASDDVPASVVMQSASRQPLQAPTAAIRDAAPVGEPLATLSAVEPAAATSAAANQASQLPPAPKSAAVSQATYVEASDPGAGDWRQQLEGAIAQLEASVKPQPGSVAELQDHMRLRTLQLLAGQQDDAYRPISGASPAQQDYWSKQLFSMSAYLDGASETDDKQRAAAALLHLDEARASLSELATLQVRNLAFVKSVDGFGVYEPRKATQFKPGEQAALYAEVENFRSTSGEEGYRSSLATSYQVLDKSGRRVEGGQFPEITDLCRTRRRDFHMQYGVALPSRIYAGEYVLELVITDQESGKIGRASLPFEIVVDQ